MTIMELTRAQLEQVKQLYYMQKQEEARQGVSYGELADIDSLVSDAEIFEACEGVDFTEEDFEAPKPQGVHAKPVHFVITRGLNAAAEKDPATLEACSEAAKRFLAGDWGNLEQEDIDANNQDLKDRDGHILGAYNTPAGKIYIELEFSGDQDKEDYAVIMFPSER